MVSTILLHPVGLDKHSWQFASVPNARAVDFPGHGESPFLPVASLDSLADYVCDQVRGKLNVVGLSLGGMVAQHVALRHPSRVHSIVIACAGSANTSQTLLDRADEVDRVGMAGILESTLSRWFTPEALKGAGQPGVQYARTRLLADDPRVFSWYWRIMAEHQLTEQLSSIDSPTTVIAGSSDAAVHLEALKRMAAQIPDARFRIVPGPHMLHLEAPVEFASAIEDHLHWSGGQL